MQENQNKSFTHYCFITCFSCSGIFVILIIHLLDVVVKTPNSKVGNVVVLAESLRVLSNTQVHLSVKTT